MEIRDLEFGDLDALLALYASDLHAEDEALPPRRELEALWERIQEDPSLLYLGAFHAGPAGDELVATCTAAIVPNLTRGARPYAVIENVVCRRDVRRQGVASLVLQALLARCWESGCYKVMLMSAAHRGESVHAFYEANGFDKHAKQAFVQRADQS